MSSKQYAILGINTELDLPELKTAALAKIKEAKIGPVADNAVHFSFGATGFIDIFEEQKEIRAEIQADDVDALRRAKGLMLPPLLETLGLAEAPTEWKLITDVVLSEQAHAAAQEAKRKAEEQA